MSSEQGKLITFEGIDGAGKTTQILLTAAVLEQRGYAVLTTREPGGTRLSEEIRRLLLDPQFGEMEPATEALLYAAARAQLVGEEILPAINAGKIVLCDRFVDSSLAYQGYGRGFGLDLLRSVNAFALAGLGMFYTIVIDLPPECGQQRFATRESDRLELECASFHQRVRDGYLAMAAADPDRMWVVDGSGTSEEVQAQVLAHVVDFLDGKVQGGKWETAV